ncbi:MAG: hypothetical protein KBE23_12030 [Chloroflexi bacterium]|nr:hypothetical protein [Chloroflexota bacterium]MBP7043465.1 hypothetical protein [Chloroflexota bacterium]
MRRYLVFLTLFLISLLAATSLAGAQEGGQPTPEPEPTELPAGTVEAELQGPTAVNPLSGMTLTLVPVSPNDVLPASDSCSSARPLTLVPRTSPAASQTNVAGFTVTADDPVLSCIWGSNPPNTKGFRTAWFQFKTDYNGMVTITTNTSAYDTILGVFTGACGEFSLTRTACNDDATGLASEVTFAVQRGVTYFVEVADRQPGALSNPLLLNMQAAFNMPVDSQSNSLVSNWKVAGSMPTPVSRHATAVVGSSIYVMGGLEAGLSLSNSFARYQTTNNTWESLNPVPVSGFANTTAVYLNYTTSSVNHQEIHIPGGSNSAIDDLSAYTNAHWVFDIVTKAWSEKAALPMSRGVPFAYAAAAPSANLGAMYVLGGVEGPGWPLTGVITDSVRDEVLLFTPDSGIGSWSTLALRMTSPRYGATAANVGGKICVAGGLRHAAGSNPPVALLSDGECFNPASPTTWEATGAMNFPRYFAHSAVGPDGRWYVYGGLDGTHKAVPEVEYYDPVDGGWHVLSYLFDLNNRYPNDPALVWPRGGFVGDSLWALGGSFDASGTQPNPIIKRMVPPSGSVFLPLILTGERQNFTFSSAKILSLYQFFSQNIDSAANRYRFYSFFMTQPMALQVDLTVPATEDLDLYLYDDNKVKWGSSEQFQGVPERICLNNLQPGKYYIMVKHVLPPTPDSNQSFTVVARSLPTCP